MGMVEIIRGPERRRRWSVEEKLSIVAEAERPGASVSATARRHDLHPNQLFSWRRLAHLGRLRAPFSPKVAGFVPVAMVEDGAGPGSATATRTDRVSGLVEIALGNGRLVRVDDRIDPVRLARLVSALDGR